MRIDASGMHFQDLNTKVRHTAEAGIQIDNCMGQRYIGSGLGGKKIVINGTAGNALGAYLDGCDLFVNGNAQDATGDTMNEGSIIINGSCGDACGYAMRGGKIFVRGSAGYRAGIHMKAYCDKIPLLVIGENAGSFLGEYQAGGLILVLGIGNGHMSAEAPIAGDFCGTGMHGGKIILRSSILPRNLPQQVKVHEANQDELKEIGGYVKEFCNYFSSDYDKIMEGTFRVLTPDTKNPYKQMYAHI